MKKAVTSFLIILLTLSASAQKKSADRPKLVVGIVVDQMRWDYLYRYYDRYSQNGFKRLMKDGFKCEQTMLNYLPSYTAPGHSTIYTGALPAIHGICGNDWIEASTLQNRYCAQDDEANAIGGSQRAGKMSPRQMKSSTIGDELRLATNFRSRVFGISIKDRGAIFPAGHLANAAYWFDDSTGNFISSDYYCKALPDWLNAFNNKKWPDQLLATNWETLYPIDSYTQSIDDSNNYEELRKGELAPIFPHQLAAGNYKEIRSLPIGNTLSFKLAKTLIRNEALGQKKETDFLCLSLSSSDYVGHAYAPNSIEVEDLYLRLDKELASFLSFLDDETGEGNYLIFLTADHGAAHNAAFLKDNKIPAGILSEYQLKKDLNKLLLKKYGTDSLVRAVMNYQVVLNERLIENKKIDREILKQSIILSCRQYAGMASVLDIENLYKSPVPNFLKELIQNGYFPSRCGPIALIYEPAWYSDGPKGTTHGTWNPYDTHIPLLWYGWNIPAGASDEKNNVTNIAATLAALLHIQMPNGANGTVIKMSGNK